MAFTSDGRTLAIGSSDTTVILWDVTDPTRPAPIGEPLVNNTGSVSSVAFTGDGHILATASFGTVTLWDVTGIADLRNHLYQWACLRSGGMSRELWARYVPDLPYHDACAR